MKSLFVILLTLPSALAHPVPDPEPHPANPTVDQLLKRAGVTINSCSVPKTVALTYVDSISSPP